MFPSNTSRLSYGPAIPWPTGVLLVEDDPDLQWNLARSLTVRGIRVVGTGSPEGALALLRQWPVDLILLDESPPNSPAHANASSLQSTTATPSERPTREDIVRAARKHLPDVSIILMAEPGAHHSEQLAQQLGADAWICKPFKFEHLQEVVYSLRDARTFSLTDPRRPPHRSPPAGRDSFPPA